MRSGKSEIIGWNVSVLPTRPWTNKMGFFFVVPVGDVNGIYLSMWIIFPDGSVTRLAMTQECLMSGYGPCNGLMYAFRETTSILYVEVSCGFERLI